MKKIKIKILESNTSKGCKHDVLTCNHCDSVITMREPKKFNVKRMIALAKKIENEMPPMLLDDDIADWEHDNLETK